jgi:hypothetical protein
MSIDKIKERIKMIEENNFEINEAVGQVNLKTGNVAAISKLPQNQIDAIYKSLSRSSAPLVKAKNIANDALGGSTTSISGNLNIVTLEPTHFNRIKNIFTVLKNDNVFPPEIDDNTFNPKIGYSGTKSNNLYIVKSERNGHVRFYFNDENQSKLLKLIILYPQNTHIHDINTAVVNLNNIIGGVNGKNVVQKIVNNLHRIEIEFN